MSTVFITSIESEGQTKKKEDHRSSENFDIKNVPSGTKYFKFLVRVDAKYNNNPDMIRFEVWHDDDKGIDETKWDGCYNGKQTDEHIGDHENYYIANPDDTSGNPFTVEIYAVVP